MALDATVGGANSNSYETAAEAAAYFATRTTVAGWPADVPSQEKLLIMATRTLEAMFSPQRKLVRPSNGDPAYYLVRPTWTGAPATTTQRLMWPRSGMYDRNGNAISTTVIPQELKDALAELAGQLGTTDLLLDNSVSVQGITSVRAGSVAVTFKSDGIDSTKIIPDAVFYLLVPSWLTDELYENANMAEFDVVSE